MDIHFSAFVATSVDGYMARPNGKLDWLKHTVSGDENEDYGYRDFMSRMNCVVMGRKSFDRVARFTEWPYKSKQVIVLSRTLKTVPKDFVDKINLYNGPLELLAVELQYHHVRQVCVEGGEAIQSFFTADLMNNITITHIPILLGRGISLFGDLADDIKLKMIDSKSFVSGFVQSSYQVERRTRNPRN